MQKRFIDDGRGINSFSNEFLVSCPKCEHIATIESGSYYCSHCNFKPSQPTIFRPPCKRCKKLFGFIFRQRDFRVDRVGIKGKVLTCSGCGHINDIKEIYGGLNIFSKDEEINQGLDPWYGMHLWLCIAIRNKVLWFYNLAHLEYVESYLQADIRERSKDAGNGSVISRLPAWIKQSKSREDVMKKISKIKATLKN
ncbi:MAG: hypothetical protein K2X53_05820 [Alphaproteobacteria bacterium]|nr:hypothetical protein [Alphaproteobacteria bacterium]